MRIPALVVTTAVLWAAAPLARAADVDGVWDMVFQTQAGEKAGPMAVTTEGESASATLGETRLTGTYKDGLLELSGEHYATDAGYTSTLTLKGRVEGAELKGEWVWAEYSSVFAGTRHQD